MPPSNMNSYDQPQGPLHSLQPSIAFVAIIFVALIAFEIFNFSTTDHALYDLLGDLSFAGIPWSIILAIAFCGIDFAGIARLFTPEQGRDEPTEVWYLFGAWLLAATMNAMLTWWGVSIAVVTHYQESSTLVDSATMMQVVPVFVAIMVWVIRILIIGTLSMALDRLMHPGMVRQTQSFMPGMRPGVQNTPSHIPSGLNSTAIPSRPAPASRPASAAPRPGVPSRSYRPAVEEEVEEEEYEASPRVRAEPSYHTLAARGRSRGS